MPIPRKVINYGFEDVRYIAKRRSERIHFPEATPYAKIRAQKAVRKALYTRAIALKFSDWQRIALILLGLSGPSLAAPINGSVQQASLPVTDYWVARLSLQQAIELVRRQTGGRVLTATVVENEDTTYFRIKLIQANGRVVTLIVDANSGQITEG